MYQNRRMARWAWFSKNARTPGWWMRARLSFSRIFWSAMAARAN